MSDAENQDVGKVGWIDMTVGNADEIRDFYADVVGFKPEAVDMGGYSDYSMSMPATGEAVAGICHARGCNEDMPGGWLIYFVVEDIEASANACVQKGGHLRFAPRDLAGGRFCIIEDPNGATAALYQP